MPDKATQLLSDALRAWDCVCRAQGWDVNHLVEFQAARNFLGKARCEACNYEHGHAIGCKNNPVDIALKQRTQAETDTAKRWICLRCKSTKKGYHSLGCPEFEMTRHD